MSGPGQWVTFAYHEGVPIVWLADGIEARRQTIRNTKPPHEHATRLGCLVALTEAQVARLPAAYIQAWVLFVLARAAARSMSERVGAAAADDPVYVEACVTYDAALVEAAPALLALALEIVPDAPWNAERSAMIFEVPGLEVTP